MKVCRYAMENCDSSGGAVVAFALAPPVSRLIGFPLNGDLFTVFRLLVAAIAVFYIVKGPPFSWTWS